MKIIELFRNLLNSLLDGSFETVKIISSMNDAFKEYYYTGELNRFCKVSISSGDSNFHHEMSAFVFRSGFKITIENDNGFKHSEAREISKYILSNKAFVRQLMSLGFDTLIIKGKISNIELRLPFKEHSTLSGFSLTC